MSRGRPTVRRMVAVLTSTLIVLTGAIVSAPSSATSTPVPGHNGAVLTAAPVVVTPESILSALGIAVPKGTYVFLVDTSRSMSTRDGSTTRFAVARQLFAKVLKSLSLSDVLIMFSFDDMPSATLYAAPLSSGLDAPLAAFPAGVNAMSNYTDMGLALQRASNLLKSSVGPDTIGAVVMFTDGEQEGNPKNIYGPGPILQPGPWGQLRQRFSSLDLFSLRGYAVPLSGGASGFRELNTVLPNQTVTVNPDPAALSHYLAAQKQALRWREAAPILTADAANGVTAEWAPSGNGHAELTLTSGYAHVPVALETVTVTDAAGKIVVADSSELNLDPHTSARLDVPLKGVSGALTVYAAVSSPWTSQIEAPATISLKQTIRGATWTPPKQATKNSPGGLGWLWIAVVLVLALLVVLWLFTRYMRRPLKSAPGPAPQGDLLLMLPPGRAAEGSPGVGRDARPVTIPLVSTANEDAIPGLTWTSTNRSSGQLERGGLLVNFQVVARPRRGESGVRTSVRVTVDDATIFCPLLSRLPASANYLDLSLGRANGVGCLYVAPHVHDGPSTGRMDHAMA
jgi:hypothetical protein